MGGRTPRAAGPAGRHTPYRGSHPPERMPEPSILPSIPASLLGRAVIGDIHNCLFLAVEIWLIAISLVQFLAQQLLPIHVGIEAVQSEQLLMGATFDDPPVVQHDNLIEVFDR